LLFVLQMCVIGSFVRLSFNSQTQIGVDPQTEILTPTNAERTKYCLAPLSTSLTFPRLVRSYLLAWDTSLALTADKYAQKCQFQTSLAADRQTAYATFLTQNGQPVPNGTYPNSLLVGENIAATLSKSHEADYILYFVWLFSHLFLCFFLCVVLFCVAYYFVAFRSSHLQARSW
jgi:hypothetical protein